MLARRLAEEPDARCCTLVHRDGSATPVTVAALLGRAQAFAAALGPPPPGERQLVAVCLYHGADLHPAFLGGLWAGHVPTMLPPPSPRMDPHKYAASFCQMVRHIRPAAVIIDQATHQRLAAFPGALDELGGTRLLLAESVPARASVPPFAAAPDDIALVQHSSGTTGHQKGIALSHRAVLRHNAAYARALAIDERDVIVSWLPLYHDMGFIACFLLPLLRGVPFVELSPFDWVLRPALLLEQLQRHGGTLCWLPNFAYSFMAESVRDLPDGLDLSRVRAFVNCSEPVLADSHAAFLQRFAPHGVHPGQLTASYAMAENVFAVTQSLPGALRALAVDRAIFTSQHRAAPAPTDAATVTFVSCGRPLPTTQVLVRDDAGQPLPEGHVGELCLAGEHRFTGYFHRDDLTAQALAADGLYRTGDLGFLHQGEVFVTGRKKDLIIIQGRNFYPADIEEVAARVEGVVPGRVVAFGVADAHAGTERLIVLLEAAGDPAPAAEKRLALRVRNQIAQELDCTPADVRVVPPRWLVKSTSGKLARGDNRAKYLQTLQTPQTPKPSEP